MTENDTFTMQAADRAELEEVEGGSDRMNPQIDILSLRISATPAT